MGRDRAQELFSYGMRPAALRSQQEIKTWIKWGYPDGSYEQFAEDIWAAVFSADEVIEAALPIAGSVISFAEIALTGELTLFAHSKTQHANCL